MFAIGADIITNREQIINQSKQRTNAVSVKLGFEIEPTTTLQDVFSFVDREKYQGLWREALKLRTIMPTTELRAKFQCFETHFMSTQAWKGRLDARE